MSMVTTCVLVYGPASIDKQAVEAAYAFEYRDDRPGQTMDYREVESSGFGGEKGPGASVFLSAHNYPLPSEWLEHLATVEWTYPEEVAAIVHSGDFEVMETWRPEIAPR